MPGWKQRASQTLVHTFPVDQSDDMSVTSDDQQQQMELGTHPPQPFSLSEHKKHMSDVIPPNPSSSSNIEPFDNKDNHIIELYPSLNQTLM